MRNMHRHTATTASTSYRCENNGTTTPTAGGSPATTQPGTRVTYVFMNNTGILCFNSTFATAESIFVPANVWINLGPTDLSVLQYRVSVNSTEVSFMQE